jgi:hypothetical protein
MIKLYGGGERYVKKFTLLVTFAYLGTLWPLLVGSHPSTVTFHHQWAFSLVHSNGSKGCQWTFVSQRVYQRALSRLNGPFYEEEPIDNFWMVINTEATRSESLIQINHNSFRYKQSSHGQRSSSQARSSSSLSHQTPSSINLATLLYGQKSLPIWPPFHLYADFFFVYSCMK